MARRRLGPARILEDGAPEGAVAPAAGAPARPGFAAAPGAPPIARIAGQSAAEAALSTLAADLEKARAEGRLLLSLPLAAVDESYLVRDRIEAPDDEAAALEASLRERGQQVPIDVVDLGPPAAADGAGGAPRYGLISGWRRLAALRRLARHYPGEFTTVLAVLRRPDTSAEAYRAMVEENELRVGLSHYERARIVVRAAGQGAFASPEAALSGLFGTVSRARRSKIGSFMRLHEALDDRLRFPAAIPERLGLDLARAVQDPDFLARLRERLRKSPAAEAGAELATLGRALSEGRPRSSGRSAAKEAPGAAQAPRPAAGESVTPGVRLRHVAGRITLSGPGADAALARDLAAWLRARS